MKTWLGLSGLQRILSKQAGDKVIEKSIKNPAASGAQAKRPGPGPAYNKRDGLVHYMSCAAL